MGKSFKLTDNKQEIKIALICKDAQYHWILKRQFKAILRSYFPLML